MPNTLTGTEAAAAIYAQVRARAARLTEPASARIRDNAFFILFSS